VATLLRPLGAVHILLLLLALLFGGRPEAGPPREHRPLHKGGIDLATGLYTRENDDLVVQGSPALVLRRTYLSGYRVSKEFGIGTTHRGEEYLIGDGERFQWAALILARGSRINFKRMTPGNTIFGARYVHEETAGEWHGAELSWTFISWTLKKRDGSVLVFQQCGKAKGSICSILTSTDPQGQTIHYRRNFAGRLMKMESGDRFIAFDYDDKGRIAHAYDNNKNEVRYAYDARGRLERVTGSDRNVSRYTYTDLDELETIEEPTASITNRWEGGRCVRQVNWYEDGDPYVFVFKYTVEGKRVHRTRISESSGHWREYAWNERGVSISETLGFNGSEPAFVMYDRDEVSGAVTSMTISCKDREGRPLRRSTTVRPGEEEMLKRAFVQSSCS
jgi:YD repeat-containing protein